MKRFLIAVLVFTSAFQITTFIHELGHYFAFLAQGADPTLYHNAVYTDTSSLGPSAIAVGALAGPIVSLVQGVICLLLLRKFNSNELGAFFLVWLCLLGFVNFFGYLMFTPLSGVGDTAQAAEALGLETGWRFALSAIGLAGAILISLFVGRQFGRFIPGDLPAKERSTWIYQLMFLPILAGGLVNVALSFPLASWLSAVYAGVSSFVIMCSFAAILSKGKWASEPPRFLSASPIAPFLVFCVLVILNRVLTIGVL